MFDMRAMPPAATGLPGLAVQDQRALRYVGKGLSPREIADRLKVDEEALYRLVAWMLDELEPAPGGQTMADVYARHGSRSAKPAERAEFERRYGPFLAPDDEG